jgi:PST family polysaccharide transporter
MLSKEYNKISKNFISLVLLQVTNFVIPILIIPHLIKTLGVDRFGIVSLAQTTMIYLFVIVDYGFSLSAVKDVSINREDKVYLNRVFSEVMITKFFLGIMAFFLLLIAVSIHPKFVINWKLFLSHYQHGFIKESMR